MYLKAGQLDPLSLPTQDLIAKALAGLGREDEALAVYNRQLELHPDFVPTYASIREIHQAAGNLAEAVRWGREALERDPGNGLYMRSLIENYLALDRIDLAVVIGEQMRLELSPDDWRFPWLNGIFITRPGILTRFPLRSIACRRH